MVASEGGVFLILCILKTFWENKITVPFLFEPPNLLYTKKVDLADLGNLGGPAKECSHNGDRLRGTRKHLVR